MQPVPIFRAKSSDMQCLIILYFRIITKGCDLINLKQSLPQMKKNLTSIVLVLLLVQIGHCHNVQQVDGGKEKIEGYVNQAKYISIPFKKCFQVETELPANQKYIHFKPSALSLQTIKQCSLKQTVLNIGTLEEIRSPLTFSHKDILIFDDYIMLFSAPNRILIIKQNQYSFSIQNSYLIQKLDKMQKFKMFKFEGKGFLTVYNQKEVFLLNQKDYSDYQLPQQSTITHFEDMPIQGQFMATQFGKGLTHYKIDKQSKRVDIVMRYGAKELEVSSGSLYTMDFTLKYYQGSKSIYVLDAQIGIIQLSLKNPIPKSKVIIPQKLCESFDSIEQDHFVLLCQSQGFSTVIEAESYIDKKTRQKRFKKLQPIFHANYLNDLHVGEKYYMVYAHKSIHAFWNTKKNRLPEAAGSQSEIVLSGLQTFTLFKSKNQIYLYTVESGQLIKYKVNEQKATLTLKSDEPAVKNFKISIYGSCLDLTEANEPTAQVKTCKVKKDILLQILQEDHPRPEDFSISASIIVILIIVFLLIIWICLKKYKGLQREARKVLQNYQKKRNSQRRVI